MPTAEHSGYPPGSALEQVTLATLRDICAPHAFLRTNL
jgi:hypothetical protein